MAKKTKHLTLEEIAMILPIGIILEKSWSYEYLEKIKVINKPDVETTIYVFKCGGNRRKYISLEVMQDMFDIKNLCRKLLCKCFNNLSNEEKYFIYYYSRIKEGIEIL